MESFLLISEKLFFHCSMAHVLHFLMDSALVLVSKKTLPL